MSVEDENVNAYPDAWEPNGPPGLQMGMGGGSYVDNSSTVNLSIDRGAVMSEVHVAANADLDRVQILVRNATRDALQAAIEQLARQLGKRIRVRI